MKILQAFFGTIIVIFVTMVIAVQPVIAQEEPNLEYNFGTVSDADNQLSSIIVENNYLEQSVEVEVSAIDPLTQELLVENQIREVEPGTGIKVIITATIKPTHLLKRKVRVKVPDIDPIRLTLTRLLTDRKGNTILREEGIPILLGPN
jgi:hypothetical protein